MNWNEVLLIAIVAIAVGALAASNLWASLAISGSDSEVAKTTITVDNSGKTVFVMWTTRDCFPPQQQWGLHLRFNSSSDGGTNWKGPPVDFTHNSPVDSSDVLPQPAFDAQKKLHLLWSRGNDKMSPYYASSLDLGLSWSDPKTIGLEGYGWVQLNGLGLSVSEDGRNLWAFHNDADWTANDCGSSDGGLTWRQLGRHIATGSDIDGGNPTQSYCSDAIIVGDYRYVLRKRNNHLNVVTFDGKKWSSSTPTPVKSPLSLADNHTIVADSEGAIYIVFSDAGEIYCMRSADSSVTWEDKVRVDDDSRGQHLLPVIGIMADGTLAVAWQDGREAVSAIRYATSKDAGKTWGASEVLSPTAKNQTAPDMYIVNETLYFSYTDDGRAFFARIPAVPPLDTSNLFPNSGFDVFGTGFDGRLPAGWSFDSWNQEFMKEKFGKVSPGRNGEGFCLELQQGSPAGPLTIRSQPVPVTADTAYVFKGYYASVCQGKMLAVGRWLDTAGKTVGSFEVKLPDTQDDWIAFFEEVYSPVNAAQLQIVITKEWWDGSVRFDDFSLRRGVLRDYASEFSLPPLRPAELRFPIYGLLTSGPGLDGEWEAECAMANFSVGSWQSKYGLRRRISAVWASTWHDSELVTANEDSEVYDIPGHDEPGKWQYIDLAEKSRRFRRLAPSKPFVVNLLPCYGPYSPYPVYRDYVRSFIETVEPSLFTYDNYALGGEFPAYGGHFFANFEIVRQEALRANVYFGFIGSVVAFHSIRSPSEAELRWQAYSALAYGARALGWFTYNTEVEYGGHNWRDAVIERDGSRSRHYSMLRRVNGEILNLGDSLLRLKSTGVFHTKPLPELTRDASKSKLISSISAGQWVVGEFVDGSGQSYFMLVNRDFTKEQKAVITFNGKPKGLFEINKTDGAQTPVKGFSTPTRSVTLTVSAGDGSLFLLK